MIRHHSGTFAAVAVAAALLARALPAQTAPAAGTEPRMEATHGADLDALVARALEVSPAIRAAVARVEAARARIGPAGALPDPVLEAGIGNLPLTGADAGAGDMATMKLVGAGQRIPFPGKRGLRERVAGHERVAAEAMLAAARLEVTREVKQAYYELAFLDRALELLERNRTLLDGSIRVAGARYEAGVGGQPDVLEARLEASRLADAAVALTAQRRAALARLNAVLDRPVDTPVEGARVPERVARAAVAAPEGVRFASGAPGARAAGPPLPPLAELQDRALRRNPELRAHEARIAAQAARVELARKERWPDFDLSLQYGQRDGRPDLISAGVSLEIPVHRRRNQDMLVKEAESELLALEAEYHARANALRATVAALHAELERERARLALYAKSILPQGRASLESATAGFRVGRVDFLTLLDHQEAIYDYETAYFQGLTGFAAKLAALEQAVGEEVLR